MKRRIALPVHDIADFMSIITGTIIIGLVGGVVLNFFSDTPDLYAPPLKYLDTLKDEEGNDYYVPHNGKTGTEYPGFCLGDRVQWTSHAVGTRDTEIVVGSYLQQLEPFSFVGSKAEALQAEYPGPKTGLKGIYAKINPPYYLSEGEYLGGYRSFVIPEAEELSPHNGLEPGDEMRVFLGVTSVLSQTAGYYLRISYGKDCPVIPATSN